MNDVKVAEEVPRPRPLAPRQVDGNHESVDERLLRVCESGTFAEFDAVPHRRVNNWRGPIVALAARLRRLVRSVGAAPARASKLWEMLSICMNTYKLYVFIPGWSSVRAIADDLLVCGCDFRDMTTVRTALDFGATQVDLGARAALYGPTSPQQTDVVELMFQRGASNFNAFLETVTGWSFSTSWVWIPRLVHLAAVGDLRAACNNAVRAGRFDLVRYYHASGKMTKQDVDWALYWACETADRPFNSQLCDFLIDVCGANDFQYALLFAVRSPAESWKSFASDGIRVLEYLHRRAPTKSLNWNDALREACADECRVHLIPYMFGAGGDLRSSGVFRYPQQRPLILKLVAFGVAPEVLATKIGGMHKFMKNAQHRRVVAAKHLRRRLPPPGLIPVVQLYILD